MTFWKPALLAAAVAASTAAGASDPPFPRVHRTFMPDAGPSAVAVQLTPDLGLCYDPLRGGVHRAWLGRIDLSPTVRAKINEPALVEGEVFLEERLVHPLRLGGAEAAPGHRFHGYRYEAGAVVFEFSLHGHAVTEALRPLADGRGFTREFAVPRGGGPLFLRVGESPRAELRVEGGEQTAPGLWSFPEGGRAHVTVRMKEPAP